jgi:hypothetical protein
MVRLYFDFYDGHTHTSDEEGEIFEIASAAQKSAAQSLVEIMKARALTADAAELMYVVKDASDQTVFTARLSLLTS